MIACACGSRIRQPSDMPPAAWACGFNATGALVPAPSGPPMRAPATVLLDWFDVPDLDGGTPLAATWSLLVVRGGTRHSTRCARPH